jgi:hypothetical protein
MASTLDSPSRDIDNDAADAALASDATPRDVHALSRAQERRLLDYFEDKLLDITRAYKKRCASRLTLGQP